MLLATSHRTFDSAACSETTPRPTEAWERAPQNRIPWRRGLDCGLPLPGELFPGFTLTMGGDPEAGFSSVLRSGKEKILEGHVSDRHVYWPGSGIRECEIRTR